MRKSALTTGGSQIRVLKRQISFEHAADTLDVDYVTIAEASGQPQVAHCSRQFFRPSWEPWLALRTGWRYQIRYLLCIAATSVHTTAHHLLREPTERRVARGQSAVEPG